MGIELNQQKLRDVLTEQLKLRPIGPQNFVGATISIHQAVGQSLQKSLGELIIAHASES